MIKSLNKSIDTDSLKNVDTLNVRLMEELESKEEFQCWGTYCESGYKKT